MLRRKIGHKKTPHSFVLVNEKGTGQINRILLLQKIKGKGIPDLYLTLPNANECDAKHVPKPP
jgi:hypothetical protein